MQSSKFKDEENEAEGISLYQGFLSNRITCTDERSVCDSLTPLTAQSDPKVKQGTP